jgi:hypothetical protein
MMMRGREFYYCDDCGTEYPIKDMSKPKQTYADRIRSMSDEELAGLLYETETQGLPFGLHVENDWLDWLKQEVDNED